MSDMADAMAMTPPSPALPADSFSSPASSSLRVASEIALATIVVILVTLIFLVSARRIKYHLAVRRAREARAAQAAAEAAARAGSMQASGLAPEGFVNLEPPRRQGLSKAVINSMGPVSEYLGDPLLGEGPSGSSTSAEEDLALPSPGMASDVGGLETPRAGAFRECAVCLCEYRLREQLRTLAKCGHHFHKDCIDAWLQTNATCPLCRTSLEPEKTPSPGPAPGSLPPAEPPQPPAPPSQAVIVGHETINETSGEAPQQHLPSSVFPSGLVVGSVDSAVVTVEAEAGSGRSGPGTTGSASASVSNDTSASAPQAGPAAPWMLLRLPFTPFPSSSLPRT